MKNDEDSNKMDMEILYEDEDFSDEEIRQLKAELEDVRAQSKQNIAKQSIQLTDADDSDRKTSNRDGDEMNIGLLYEDDDCSDEEICQLKAELACVRSQSKQNDTDQIIQLTDTESTNRESDIKDKDMYLESQDTEVSNKDKCQMKAEFEINSAEKKQHVTEQKMKLTDTENSDRKSSNRVVSYFQYCCCIKSAARFQRYRVNSCEQGQDDNHDVFIKNDIPLNERQDESYEKLGKRRSSKSSIILANTENKETIEHNDKLGKRILCNSSCIIADTKNEETIEHKKELDKRRSSNSSFTVTYADNEKIEHNEEIDKHILSNSSFVLADPDNEVTINHNEDIIENKPSAKYVKAKHRNCSIDYTDFKLFICKIGLGTFFPEKMQLSDVMKIKAKEEFCDLEGIAFMFIRNLVMINFTCRDKMLEEYLHGMPLPRDDTSESDNDHDIIWDDSGDNTRNMLNPLDLILAVFKCSSPMLKQVLAAKLFMCRLAIPIVFPAIGNDAMLLSTWHLRSVLIDSKSDNRSIQNIAVDCPCQIVSFIRLGNPTISKSKLINGVLTDQYHDTFVNKDSPLGTTKRILSDGMIEVAWYIPSSTSSFSNSVLMFLNLRGDCECFAEQVKLVSSISSVIVIIIEIEGLVNTNYQKVINALHNVRTGIILAIDAYKDSKTILKEKIKTYSDSCKQFKDKTGYIVLSIDGQERGISIIRKEMRKKINDLLQEKKDMPLCEILRSCIVEQDENSECLSSTRQMVEGIIKRIPEDSTCESIKKQIIPLQGKLWSTWSKHNKDVNKASQYKNLEERGVILNEMTKIRQNQVKLFKELGSFMQSFINLLIELLPSANDCIVFVLLVKHYFDNKSRCILPSYLSKYQSNWQALKSFRDEDNSDAMKRLKGELQKSEINLAEASFGFEHLCREMGQLYEALCSSKTTEPNLKELKQQLPMITAKLLLLGFPFEIMDGDVANVPVLWVKAVLTNLKKIIGDKKILALSVLGIQSSGKSTLLNTMFGLQFAVSAGRCTRGVFVQLVPVDDKSLLFDYVLVIDTEGLRAPELGEQKHSHDNELATFVIGLGDITVVNIKGENTAEVKDVLQITVHAFLRLKLANKELNLKQSCVFVHQNVPAVDANDKMMQGRQTFVEILDTMTKEAAEEEDIAEIHSFNQVIEFNSEKNVFYFSDLWFGDPPMCPANPGYSESVKTVKNAIIFDLAAKIESYLTVTDTISRIEDLWNGILTDDFVFSFRNTLELKAYNDMERKCRNLTWELEKTVLEFLKSDAESNLVKCENPDELENVIPSIVLRLGKTIDLKKNSMVAELDSFIDKSNLKEVMSQWKQTKRKRFQFLAEDLILESKKEINKRKEEVHFKKTQMREQTKHQIEINEMAKSLAKNMQGEHIKETVLKKMFDEKWNTWIDNFLPTEIRNKLSIKDQIDSMIRANFSSDAAFLEKTKTFHEQYYKDMSKLEGTLPIAWISKEHISIHKAFFGYDKDNSKNCIAQTFDIINNILRKIDTKLLEIKAEDKRFNLSYVTEIVNFIKIDIEDHNNKCTAIEYNFNLLPPFRALMLAHVLAYATIVFTRLHDAYYEKHSPKGQMQTYKGTAWALFKNLVQSNTEDVIALGFFREALVVSVEEYVSGLLHIDAQYCILCSFSNGKFSLIKDILKQLAEEEQFQNIKAFIQDPHAFAEGWVLRLTNVQLFEEKSNGINSFTRLAKSRISQIFSQLSECITQATQSTETSISIWIENFVKHCEHSNGLPLSNAIFVHVKDLKVPDLHNFVEMLKDQLDEIEKVVIDHFKQKDAETFKWKTNPVVSIMNKLWGCKEVCMFCKEPCMNTDKNHVEDGHPHKCLQHRPEGIGGIRWKNTGNLEEKFCNHSVDTDNAYINIRGKSGKYREYKDNFPDWEIAPNSDVSIYWIWIFFKFQVQFEKMHNAKLPKFPVNWASILKSEAIDSLG